MTITKEETIAKYGKHRVFSWQNGDWEWKDQEKWMHLMRWVDSKWIELTKGIKATYVWSYLNGDWGWRDQDWNLHEVKGEITAKIW